MKQLIFIQDHGFKKGSQPQISLNFKSAYEKIAKAWIACLGTGLDIQLNLKFIE